MSDTNQTQKQNETQDNYVNFQMISLFRALMNEYIEKEAGLTISYEDYKKLSDEEKASGNYYIYDANSVSDFNQILDSLSQIETNTEGYKLVGALAIKALLAQTILKTNVVDNLLSTRSDLPLSANMGRVIKEDMVKPPSTYTLISNNFTSGGTYEVDEDCWMCARCTTNATTYAILSIGDKNNPMYEDKTCFSGISNRAATVKLYVKKGTTIAVSKEGALGNISLYKLV